MYISDSRHAEPWKRGEKSLELATIRQRGKIVGFSIRINSMPNGVVLEEPLADNAWHMVCVSLDDKNYLRFNLNGDTEHTQKIRKSDGTFGANTEIMLGNGPTEDGSKTFGFKERIRTKKL